MHENLIENWSLVHNNHLNLCVQIVNFKWFLCGRKPVLNWRIIDLLWTIKCLNEFCYEYMLIVILSEEKLILIRKGQTRPYIRRIDLGTS